MYDQFPSRSLATALARCLAANARTPVAVAREYQHLGIGLAATAEPDAAQVEVSLDRYPAAHT